MHCTTGIALMPSQFGVFCISLKKVQIIDFSQYTVEFWPIWPDRTRPRTRSKVTIASATGHVLAHIESFLITRHQNTRSVSSTTTWLPAFLRQLATEG